MSKTQRNRIEELERALNMAYYQLKHVDERHGCLHGCGGYGAIQIAEDEWQECQWCGEHGIIKNTLGIKDEAVQKPLDDELPF